MVSSSATTILVVGDPKDTQTAHQIRIAHKLGAKVVALAPNSLQVNSAWCWWLNGSLQIRKEELPRVDGVLVRAVPSEYPMPDVYAREPDKKLDWGSWFHESCLQRDRFDTLFGLLLTMDFDGVPMCNRPSRSILSRRKPYQLQILRRSGCPLPATIVTNEPQEARAFRDAFKHAIVKPAGGGALTLSLEELDDERLNEIRWAPAIVQERIFGKDLRVMVLNGEVVSSAAIEVPDDTLDFRGVEDYGAGKATYSNVDLPREVLDACARATSALGLTFAGIDIKHTSDGRFVFLECNSSPIYLDVERKLGHPITENLMRSLIEAADGFRSTREGS